MLLKKGLNGLKTCPHGQPCATLTSYPVLVRQNGTGCKQCIENGLFLIIGRPEERICFYTGLIDFVAIRAKIFLAMPLTSAVRLPDRQIKYRFMDFFSIGCKTLAKKSSG